MSSSFLPSLISDYPSLLRKLRGKTARLGIEKRQKLRLGGTGFSCSEEAGDFE
ncbi:hypothetical protein SLEP1_g32402 [Rubroshorea leprosula]|uniref:Uncharacterized protein n=1 Tax=Rubroshorea leprosula TaxID=152421 RepID=A0AAV5KD78_9ROSI|nr:hypothetical protein SLEP1_g32402 [Rubroshorea leprosula]